MAGSIVGINGIETGASIDGVTTGVMVDGLDIEYSIESQAANLQIDNGSNTTDSSIITVLPGNVDTTCVKYDTGDGVEWFRINGGTVHTGGFTVEIELFGTPPTEDFNARLDISDDAAEIATVNINVSYIYQV